MAARIDDAEGRTNGGRESSATVATEPAAAPENCAAGPRGVVDKLSGGQRGDRAGSGHTAGATGGGSGIAKPRTSDPGVANGRSGQ